MNQGSIGCQYGKRAGSLSGTRQLEHQVVPTDQQVGLAVLGEFQKHLVVRVAAFRQGRQSRAVCTWKRQHRQVRPIALHQTLPAGFIQSELWIAGNTFQLSERSLVCQADNVIIANGLRQRGQRRCLEMKQIHHHIGVQHQSGRFRYV